MLTAPNDTLVVRESFSETPGPRYRDEGEFSGEEFREEILSERVLSAIEAKRSLTIDLDGTAGYGTSFLEEAFGGLIRTNEISLSDFQKYIRFKSEEEPYLVEDIQKYMKDAENDQ